MHNNPEFWQKLDQLLKTVDIVIDRPKNSAHPRYPDFIYPVDYGYLKGTVASDGNEIDIWVGTDAHKEINGILCTVDPVKKDVETKIVYACTEQEIETIYTTMNKILRAIFIARQW
jgi:inorganic pyrophosphatase